MDKKILSALISTDQNPCASKKRNKGLRNSRDACIHVEIHCFFFDPNKHFVRWRTTGVYLKGEKYWKSEKRVEIGEKSGKLCERKGENGTI